MCVKERKRERERGEEEEGDYHDGRDLSCCISSVSFIPMGKFVSSSVAHPCVNVQKCVRVRGSVCVCERACASECV